MPRPRPSHVFRLDAAVLDAGTYVVALSSLTLGGVRGSSGAQMPIDVGSAGWSSQRDASSLATTRTGGR